MEPGTKLKQGILYWTKDGSGKVVPFNEGQVFGTRPIQTAIMPVSESKTKDVWCAGICRNIKSIAETEE